MHRAVRQAPEADPTLPSLSLGIGIVSGEVIVGSVGGADRLAADEVRRTIAVRVAKW